MNGADISKQITSTVRRIAFGRYSRISGRGIGENAVRWGWESEANKGGSGGTTPYKTNGENEPESS